MSALPSFLARILARVLVLALVASAGIGALLSATALSAHQTHGDAGTRLASCAPHVVASAAAPPSGELLEPRLERLVRRLQDDLVVHTFAAPTLQVRVSAELQAQARAHLGQGVMEVTQGLLEAGLTDDELYAVLGHEAAHLAYDTGACAVTPAEQQAQELRADELAVDLLERTGRGTDALARALRKLQVGPVSSAAGTHPSLAVRLAALERRAAHPQ